MLTKIIGLLLVAASANAASLEATSANAASLEATSANAASLLEDDEEDDDLLDDKPPRKWNDNGKNDIIKVTYVGTMDVGQFAN